MAARADRLTFSTLNGAYGALPWDAPVSRVETGAAWAVSRNVIVRAALQHNRRTRGAVRSSTVPALQATLWF